MANAKRKAEIQSVLQDLDMRLDSIFPMGIEFDYTSCGVWMTGQHIFKDTLVPISMYFSWDKPLSDVRIMFISKSSAYMAKRYGLRETISMIVLNRLEKSCIDLDLFHLYIDQIR